MTIHTDVQKFHMNIGDTVAWRLLDGRTMTGTLDQRAAYGARWYVRRLDGGICGPIAADKLRTASYDDVLDAIAVLKHQGE